MDDAERIRLSRFLSLVLRHRPQQLGIELEPGGWVAVDSLLAGCAGRDRAIRRADLEAVVARCEKQRFAFSNDGQRIRASQGHTVEVELGYEPVEPPELLFHGTAQARLASIHSEGLRRMRRHHVHLSEDAETARRVGERHGKAVVLIVRAKAMHAEGQVLYVSTNRVWLTEHVAPTFLEVLDRGSQ